MANIRRSPADEASPELNIDTAAAADAAIDGNGTLTMTDMMVSPVDQLPQYALGQPVGGAGIATSFTAPTSPSAQAREVKDPIYAPFLPSDMTTTSGDGTVSSTSFSFSSPSDIGHSPSSSRPSRATNSRMQSLSLNTDVPSPMYSLTPPSATAGGGVSVTAPLSPFTEVDIAEWKRGTEPFVEASANVDDDGQIDVSIEVRGPNKPLPPLPSPQASMGGSSAPSWSPLETSMTTVNSSVSSQSEMPSLATAYQPKAGSKRKGKGKEKETAWYEGTVPVMNIVIFIVGSRGDVQPYVALALALITTHGHRVRIATHPDFQQFVLSANTRLKGQYHRGVPLEGRLEFFDAGGDPKSLMEYMVKNPGLLPGFDSIKNGDIGRKQRMTADMLRGFYRSTFCPDIQSGREFAADAIVSNPPAFAHIHVAEALGVPLHMSFTMPWTATTSFPHPLVNVSRSNADKSLTNWMGYGLADILMWQGLGGQINLFRTQDLRIDELPDRIASDLIDRQRIPWTYCWSPELLPKPLDWRGHLDISGFYFLDGDNTYNPPADLREFLEAGEAPVYIGFGSVVIKDPSAMTDMLFEAIEAAGVRAIISAGWAGLGKGREGTDPSILIWSKDVPHEWLFANNRVSAVMHHGGAGTTACGLRHGRPTIIVPFFGDQKFWGEAVHRAGAGPAPIPIKTVSVELLAAALSATKTEAMREAAGVLGGKIRSEKGELIGVESFQRHLPLSDMRCDIDPRRVATMYCPRLSLRLSPEAAGTLLERGRILSHELEVYRTKEYETTRVLRGPISSTGLAMNNIMTTTVSGVSQLFYSPIKGSIKTFYGVPEASLAVVGDMYEGFQNMPGIMGSTVRRTKPVTGFVSGMAEGGKALGFGLWDGIFGFFLDPIDGARREGFAGFGKGLGRGSANLFFRPIAGSLGFFVHPTRGAAQSIKNMFSGPGSEATSVLFSPRLYLAKEAAANLPSAEKDAIVSRLTELEKEAKKRAKERKGGRVFLLANRKEREEERAARERERKERAMRGAVEQVRKVDKKRPEEQGDVDVEMGPAEGIEGSEASRQGHGAAPTYEAKDAKRIGRKISIASGTSQTSGTTHTNLHNARSTESTGSHRVSDPGNHQESSIEVEGSSKGKDKGKGTASKQAVKEAAKAAKSDKAARKAKEKEEKKAKKLEEKELKRQRKEWEEEKKMMLRQEQSRRESATEVKGVASVQGGIAVGGDVSVLDRKGKGRANDLIDDRAVADGPAVATGMSQLTLSDPQPAASQDYSVPKASWRRSSAFGFRRRSSEVVTTLAGQRPSEPTASPQPPALAPPLPPRRPSKAVGDISSVSEITTSSSPSGSSDMPPSWRANSPLGFPDDSSVAKGRLSPNGSVAASEAGSNSQASSDGTWRP